MFWGPQYNRYDYGNRLDYWTSNKGRLHDVDLTKASLIDVDFRGGEVANRVFCGPQYNRYYYRNRLDYWTSNKGRIHDVDLTKSSQSDVDFRGGIELSTTKFQTDYETDR